MHTPISPAILYWGTPVVLITTTNPDGTPNIAPISSAWWLAHRCVVGLGGSSQSTENLLRTGNCVINLPTDDMAPAVNRLARTTGTDPVPVWKASTGHVYVKDKFAHAGLTPQASEVVATPRIKECAVQMEAELAGAHEMMEEMGGLKGAIMAVELRIVRTHVEEALLLEGHANRIDAAKMRPLIMCFQEFYAMGPKVADKSRLAEVQEENYRVLTGSTVVEGEVVEVKKGELL
ncbi:uncharacterized protein BDZ99DRAFT_551931 [Mytilinidion resinicola]|uniref:Flavin reductase like domain-containing protein n=1 Tax=Mytilinidion resinicola TaxID=574789 RepID=A0A6A6Y1M3_9PEZI|nr:uncharacterized protein BDZ99DRAFT_551931 [Mytilinidion resinicola]KAF2802135.1 hypothetical protein BDZ99DRAFT_551931 [Mytilinidion resinicola]